MELKINCSPHLGTHQIVKNLFNNKFRSDVWFEVDGKTIYAHSLVLNMRSVVFQRQLDDTWGNIKKITIHNFKYGLFFQFIQFLYTDECGINIDNGIELLKLASHYQVVTLESRVINLLDTNNWILRLFEHCVIEGYEIARRRSNLLLARNFAACLTNKQFLSLHPDAVHVALQLDEIEKDATEILLLDTFAKWLDNYCTQHKLVLRRARLNFYYIFRKIRFPSMTSDEIRDCANKYPWLLSESDCKSIGKQVKYGSGSVQDLWISKRRNVLEQTLHWRIFDRDTSFVTIFEVSHDTILQGLWIGADKARNKIEIEIIAVDFNSSKRDQVKFTQSASGPNDLIVICFGDSIQFKSNSQCTISIKYLQRTDKQITVANRIENLSYNNPDDCIEIVQAGGNLFEMVFKPVVAK